LIKSNVEELLAINSNTSHTHKIHGINKDIDEIANIAISLLPTGTLDEL
jgi:hypothetical protein